MKNLLSSVFAGISISLVAASSALALPVNLGSATNTMSGCALPTDAELDAIVADATATINLSDKDFLADGEFIQEGDVLEVLFDLTLNSSVIVEPACLGLFEATITVGATTTPGLLTITATPVDPAPILVESVDGYVYEGSFTVVVGDVPADTLLDFSQDFTVGVEGISISNPLAPAASPIDLGAL